MLTGGSAAALVGVAGCASGDATPPGESAASTPTADEQRARPLKVDQTATQRTATIESLAHLDDHPLYSLTWEGEPAALTPPDEAEAGGQLTGFACTLFAASPVNGSALVARNFDWDPGPASVMESTLNSGRPTLAVTDLRYSGIEAGSDLEDPAKAAGLGRAEAYAFDGMNDAGVFIGLAADEQAEPSVTSGRKWIGGLSIQRMVLDHAASLEDALDLFDDHNVDFTGGPGLHYLVADRTGAKAVVEYDAGTMQVLGLTTAFNLVEDGHDVAIVDKTGPYAQASNRSFAWINANHKLPAEYHRLNRAGITAHEEFQKRFAKYGTWFHQHGCIMFDSTPDTTTRLDERFDESAELDYPVERIDSDRLRDLEPTVNWPAESGLFFPLEAHLDNEAFGRLVRGILEEADVAPEVAEVVRVETSADGASVEFADGDTRNFDQVIIAAGADSGAIADRSGLVLPVADLSQPGPRTHSLLSVTAPTVVDLNRIVISDKINVRPRRDGSMFVQIPSVEVRTEEGESPELLEEVRAVMEAELESLFGQHIPVDKVIFSGRSFPEDGLSIVGYLDEHHRAYSLVTHSGMTMAPLLGRLVADELRGDTSSSLEVFRPSRFASGVTPESPTNFIGRQ